MIDDYSERKHNGNHGSTIRKDFALTSQFVCSIIFVIEILFQLYYRGFWKSKNAFFKNPWHVFNFFSVLSSLIVSFDGLPNSLSIILRVIGMLRPLKFIYHIRPYKKQLERFTRSVSLLGESIVRLFIFMVFFAVLGLNIFKGAFEYRCRVSPEPPIDSDNWEIAEDIPYLCGQWLCPEDTYCRAPIDYNFPFNIEEVDIPEMGFGFISFDNFFKAFLTVIHLAFINNWSKITFLYWRYVNTLLVSVYFTSACIFLFHILVSMILAIFYDSFELQKGIKNFREFKQKMIQNKEQKNMVNLKNLEDEMTKMLQEKEKELKKMEEQKIQENNTSGISKQKTFLRQITSKIKKIGSNDSKNNYSVDGSPQNQFQIDFPQNDSIDGDEEEKIPISVKIYASTAYQFIVQLYIFIQIIMITLDRYPLSDIESNVYIIIQLILNVFFFLEVVFKIYLFRAIYFKGFLDVIDLIILITVTSINIYYLKQMCEGFKNPLQSEDLRGLQTVKSIEILRIFQLIIYCPLLNTVQYLIEIFVQSIRKLSYCVLFALIGNYLFAFKAYFDANEKIPEHPSEGKSPRVNYDSFLDSLEAIMLIILNDEWYEQMYQYMRALGEYVALFWVIVIFTGTMLVMNLLRALFIKTYLKFLYESSISIKEPIDKLQNVFKRFHKFGELQTPLPPSNSVRQNVLINKLSNFKFSVFSNNKLTVFISICSKIEKSPKFINTLILMTVANTALLAAQSRLEDPESNKIKGLRICEMITMVIYFFEAIVKIVSRGFLFSGKNSYMRQFKNIFDLFLLITQMLSLIVYPDLVIFRTLRTLNLLHLSKYFIGIRVMLSSLTQSLTTILKLLLFTLCILVVFAIIPMKQLKGKMYYCQSLENELLESIITKQECLDYGGDWINREQNWDNILVSLFNLFIMASCEGWSIIMGQANDAHGIDKNPHQDQHKVWSLYFIVYFILGNIMLFNAFTGVLIEKYIDIKKKFAIQQEIIPIKDKSKLKKTLQIKINFDPKSHTEAADEVVEWMEIKKAIYETQAPKIFQKPLKEQDYIRHMLYQLINNRYYKICMDACIVLSTLCFALHYSRSNKDYQDILETLNHVFLIIYIIEICSKIFVERQDFFRKRFQRFEVIMASVSLLYLIIIVTSNIEQIRRNYRELYIIMEFISVFRVLRLAKTIHIVRKTLNILFYILPEIAPVAGLLLFTIYMYALIGMQIFPFIKVQQSLNGYDHHFKTFNTAVFTLVRVASAEIWFVVVNDVVRQQQPNFVCQAISTYDEYIQNGLNGCGTPWGYLYFFSFHLLVSVIILNLFIAVLLELIIGQNSAISKYQLSKIKELWSEYDRNGYGFINYVDFWQFTSRIALIYGVEKDDLINPVQKKNFLKFLQLPLYTHKNKEGKSYFGFRFHDVVIQMTQISLFLRFGIFPGGPIESPNRIEQFYRELDEKNKFIAEKSDLKSGDIGVIVLIQRRIKSWMRRGQQLYNIKQKNPNKYDDLLNEFHQSYRSLNLNNVVKSSQKVIDEDEQSIFKKQNGGTVHGLSNFKICHNHKQKIQPQQSNDEEGSSQFSDKQIQESPQDTNKLADSILSHDFNKIYSNKFESFSSKLKSNNIEKEIQFNKNSIVANRDTNINIINFYNITNNYYSNNNINKIHQNNQYELSSSRSNNEQNLIVKKEFESNSNSIISKDK